ncbi:MAG: exo-alpha-sialidase [Chloroflexi bacterium]|nr:exo-alpha-sialidase [Chloroflexota bacterium]
MTKKVAVLVGTKKGAYIFRSGAGRSRWAAEGPLFSPEPVHHLAYDPRDGSIYAACNLSWGGPKIRVTRDLGKTWKVVSNPAFKKGKVATTSYFEAGADFPKQVTEELALKRTWHIEPGHASQPKVMWAGVEPAALFKSEDRGETWSEVESLTDHPTRPQWSPGGGGLMLHSIGIDAADPKRMHVGLSGVGVFATTDGGKTWKTRNEGIPAPYSPPESESEIGRCVHHLVAHPTSPRVLFQQNHFAPCWLVDDEPKWKNVSAGLPEASHVPNKDNAYGFAAAVHPQDDKTAYVIPIALDRLSPEPGIAVYGTKDRGGTWKRLAKGLPKGRAEVFREGMSTDRLDPAGIYFGTVAGELWGSADEGRSWDRIAQYLPPIMAVSTATI